MLARLGTNCSLWVVDVEVLPVHLYAHCSAVPGLPLTASLRVRAELGYEIGGLLDDGAARRTSTSAVELVANLTAQPFAWTYTGTVLAA